MPQIDRHGVLYEDNLYKRDARNGRVVFKYVPHRAVATMIREAGQPIVLKGPLRTFAMDRQRVAVAYGDRANGCDRIAYWNVPWSYVAPITRIPDEDDDAAEAAEEYPTCAESVGRLHVAGLSIGHIQATWILSGRVNRLVTSNSAACVEHAVATGTQVRVVAADGGALAYGTQDGRVGILTRDRVPRAHAIAGPGAKIAGISADSGRIAVLRKNGFVEIRTASGDLLTSISAPRARAVALRAEALLALTDNTLDIFDAETATLRSSWRIPDGVQAEIDAHYGVAVLTRNHQIFAMNLASGKLALLATAPASAHAQIEAPGITYGYNVNGRAHLHFIPLSQIERRTS